MTETTIGPTGGLASLVDPTGTAFKLIVPDGAVFDAVNVTMARTDPLPNLPANMRAIATVELGPEGLQSAKAPILTISGTSAASTGYRIGFLANDDGSEIELSPLLGPDIGAAALPALVHELEVTHFSKAGVIEVDENDLDLELVPLPPTSDAEKLIRRQLAEISLLEAEAQRKGLESPLVTRKEEIDSWFDAWLMDLAERSNALSNATLELFWRFLQELSRVRTLGDPLEQPPLEQSFDFVRFATTSSAGSMRRSARSTPPARMGMHRPSTACGPGFLRSRSCSSRRLPTAARSSIASSRWTSRPRDRSGRSRLSSRSKSSQRSTRPTAAPSPTSAISVLRGTACSGSTRATRGS